MSNLPEFTEGPSPLTDKEVEELKALSPEKLYMFRGMMQKEVDLAVRVKEHYQVRLEAVKREIRVRKKEGRWDEEAARQELNKVIFLAKQGNKPIDEVLRTVDMEVDKDLFVEPTNYKKEEKPGIIVPPS